MPGPVFLTGDAVDFHAVSAGDEAFIARGLNHPEVRRWMRRRRPQGDLAVAETYETYAEGGTEADFVVCTDGVPVGFASLFDVHPDAGRAEIGAWFLPEEQGQGYGTETVELLVAYAFEERRLHRIDAGTMADNEASKRIVEKCGFEREGRRRDHYYRDGEHVDRVVYGLLREEWGEA